jgi:hypothetical protein
MKKSTTHHRGMILFPLLLLFLSLFTTHSLHAQVSISSQDTKTGTGSTVHNLTSVPSGRLLVLVTLGELHSSASCSVSSSPSLTWTKRVDAQATNSGDAEIWTAVTTSSGNITVTSDWPGAANQASICYIISGQETTLGGATATGTSQSAPSVNITTTRANSIIIGGISDWNAVSGGSRTYRDGSVTERLYHYVSGAFTAYGFDRTAATATTYTEGLSSPTGQSGGTVLYEVRPNPPADTTPPSAPTLTSPDQGSTTIDLSWTTSTDNVAVTGYEIYIGGVYHATTTNTTYQLTGLTPSTTYSIYVRAKDAAGNGNNSNTITPTTDAASCVTIVATSTDAETSSATQHVLSSVPAGALLVLTTVNATDNANCSVSSSPSLTWVKRADAEATNSGNAEIYTAVFTAGGNITVNSSWGSSDQSSVCYVVTNYEEGLAGNAAFVSSQSAPSLTRNTSRDNSIVFCATSDWNAINGSSRTYRNSPTERLYGYNNGSYTYYHYTKQTTTAGSLEMGLSAPSGQSAGTVSYEIRCAPGVGDRQNLVFDQGFEGSHPFDNFSVGQDAGHAWSRQQSGTHENEGSNSFRAEVRSGCDGYVSSGYRSEILPANITDNGIMWYGLSIYLDEPFSGSNWTGSEAGHFLQWHPNNGSGSATMGLWGSDGEWDLVTNPGNQHDARHHYTGVDITRGWHHIVFKVNWSNTDGYVQVWIDGDLIFDLEDGEASSWYGSEILNWHTEGRYLKVGMNRWGNCTTTGCPSGSVGPCDTWILYYDNVRIGNASATYNDVAPVTGGGSRVAAPKPFIPTPVIISDYTLGQNFPNPFSKQTNIPFTLKKAGNVTLSLFDVNGQLVKILASGSYGRGRHLISLDAGSLPKGVYYYKIQADDFRDVKKLTIQ